MRSDASHRTTIASRTASSYTLERLLTLQATLAALTYPIVLALVRILFQRSWADLRVQVYLAYSGALLAGSSALLAIAAIASFVVLVQHNVSPFVNAIARLTFLAWFLTNIALTAYFIYRSLRYLDPSEQQRSLLLYTVTAIWPNELQRRLMQLRLRHAPDLDWPPNANDNQIPYVDVSPITLRGEIHEVRIESPTPQWLRDVWLRPLRFVARSWQTRCVASVGSQTESGMSADHWLFFPMSYGSSLEPPFDLCRRRGRIGLQRRSASGWSSAATSPGRSEIRQEPRLSWSRRSRVPRGCALSNELGL